MDNEFIFKQLLAIDELKPSSITSGIAIFGEVYARAGQTHQIIYLLTYRY